MFLVDWMVWFLMWASRAKLLGFLKSVANALRPLTQQWITELALENLLKIQRRQANEEYEKFRKIFPSKQTVSN